MPILIAPDVPPVTWIVAVLVEAGAQLNAEITSLLQLRTAAAMS
jgi:hypothetical protein